MSMLLFPVRRAQHGLPSYSLPRSEVLFPILSKLRLPFARQAPHRGGRSPITANHFQRRGAVVNRAELVLQPFQRFQHWVRLASINLLEKLRRVSHSLG